MRDISKEFGLNYLIRKPSSPSYTLAELEVLMQQYVKEHDSGNKLTRELVVSSLLYWLAKREREVGDGAGGGKRVEDR